MRGRRAGGAERQKATPAVGEPTPPAAVFDVTVIFNGGATDSAHGFLLPLSQLGWRTVGGRHDWRLLVFAETPDGNRTSSRAQDRTGRYRGTEREKDILAALCAERAGDGSRCLSDSSSIGDRRSVFSAPHALAPLQSGATP